MKAYLVTTGTLFGLIAVMHLVKSINDRPLLATDPWYFLGMSALGVVAAALSVWAWCLLGLSSWVLMLGFDLGVSPLAAALVTIAVGLSLILPSSPGAVGVFETAALVALKAYGVPKSGALSYALVLHAVNFFPYVAAGAVVLHAHAFSLRRGP